MMHGISVKRSVRLGSHTLQLVFSLLLIFASTTAFHLPETGTSKPRKLITLDSDEFQRYASLKYHALNFSSDTLSYEAYIKALKGYTYLKATDQLMEERYLSIIDFNLHCNQKRMWVIDLQEDQILFNELVAHGRRSGSTYANTFSNQHRSNKSSLGFYLTGGVYVGRNGASLKLNGLEHRFNSNAFSRGIVIHGAHYVSERFVERDENIGRSFGCPAVDARVNRELINLLKGGSCLFIYHNNPYYNENSHILTAEIYLPADMLK